MKKFLKVIFILTAAVSIGSFCEHWNSTVQSPSLSTILLQNVEALASGENLPQTVCICSGSVNCPIHNEKVDYVSQGYGFIY